MKIILVDDERIVIDHIRSMVPDGYEIAATASNGRSALRLCEEHQPQIMIVDIRMPVMDGLELIRAVSNKQLGVKFIVLSAYEDFEYARQAITLGGVSSYLIKHQVDSHTLREELDRARLAWEKDQSQRRMQRNELIKKYATGSCTPLMLKNSGIRAPFALLIIRTDLPFTTTIPHIIAAETDIQHHERWSLEEVLPFNDYEDWELLGDFMINGAEMAALFSIKIRNPRLLRESLNQFTTNIQTHFTQSKKRTVSVYYTLAPTDAGNLPYALNKLKTAMLYAIFCGRQALVCVDHLSLPDETAMNRNRTIPLDSLMAGLEQYDVAVVENEIKGYFHHICESGWNLRGLFDLVNLLNKFLNDQRMNKGLPYIDPFAIQEYDPVYHISEVRDRFITLFTQLASNTQDTNKVSHKLIRALQYLHDHFHEDINIDHVSDAIGVSSSYLYQLFKRDLGRTFLDYLTEYRINQAKRILRYEDIKMMEVASRVGYRSPQHFSQVFKKITGVLPHQYREEGHLL
ncbi:MAG: helix-turn-helix domain-containing protein [Paenibacillaceae bacterium]